MKSLKGRPMSSKDKTCEVCSYFEQNDDIKRVASGTAGLCRYNPPLIMETMAPVAQWPVVQVKDWCGRFTIQSG